MFSVGSALVLFAQPVGGDQGRPTQHDWLLPGVQDGKFGYVGRSGQFVIPPQFDLARNFTEGLACVQQGGKWGFVDNAGTLIIPPQFDWAYDFTGGVARIGKGLQDGLIDKTGRVVWLDAGADPRNDDRLKGALAEQDQSQEHTPDEWPVNRSQLTQLPASGMFHAEPAQRPLAYTTKRSGGGGEGGAMSMSWTHQ